MTDQPLDLAPLDPKENPPLEDRVVRAIMGQLETDAWTDRATLMAGVRSLASFVWIGMGLIVCVAGGILLGESSAPPRQGPQTIAESLGLPRAVAAWMGSETRAPKSSVGNGGRQ
jgi:hypothetical protein